MDRNNYDRDACEQYFEAYKECKKAMVSHDNILILLKVTYFTVVALGGSWDSVLAGIPPLGWTYM
jgi:hypothetical protein